MTYGKAFAGEMDRSFSLTFAEVPSLSLLPSPVLHTHCCPADFQSLRRQLIISPAVSGTSALFCLPDTGSICGRFPSCSPRAI